MGSEMNRNISLKLRSCAVLLSVMVSGSAMCEEENMSIKSLASKELAEIFGKNKLVCFGRYAMEVPKTAEIMVGGASIPDEVEIFPVEGNDMNSLISKEVGKIMRAEKTAEVIYNGSGPVSQSWQIRYFSDKYTKSRNAVYFSTFVAKSEVIFLIGDAVSPGESESLVIDRQSRLAKSLRVLHSTEVPSDPGFCIGNGFIADAAYDRQEMIDAGIHFPEYPDVTFSISSNKDAYSDLKKSDFENMKQYELPLLARIKQAKDIQGDQYPWRKVLREGKRSVQHWHGEESLFRREDGTHDFEWAFVGTPKDVANPSEYRIKMFTKVAHNTVGAAEKASLTDEEAVALWDKLLSGLKFRVKVPGAPEGSYYFLPGARTEPGTKP
jgi:hypothetical protein